MPFHLLLMSFSSSNGCRYAFVQTRRLNSALDTFSTFVLLAFVGIPVNDITRISGWPVCYGFHKNDNSYVKHCIRAEHLVMLRYEKGNQLSWHPIEMDSII
ncbi:hypothetical protein ACFX1X_029127 [Malus domestica]